MIGIDVRIIAATNKDLYREVFHRRFREDLYFRISVLHIKIPPLQERKEDIPLLATALLEEINKEYGYTVTGMEKAVLDKLVSYDWPGNVRELRNTMERMAILFQEGRVTLERIKPYFTEEGERLKLEEEEAVGQAKVPLFNLKELEKRAILQALEATNNNKSQAAQLLGINRSTLLRKLADYEGD